MDWERLRADTTFADGAEPSRLVRDVWSAAQALPGWFTVDDCGHFALVLELQRALGVSGDLLEIGVYHGRSALVMAHFVGAAERLVLCDPFDACGGAYPEQSSAARVCAAIAAACPSARLDMQACRSAQLRLDPQQRFRFIHVDGDHTRDGAAADLRLCVAHLAPGGVIAVDDYRHRDFPEVSVAVDAVLAESPGLRVLADLNRHGAVGRKIYLIGETRRPA